MGSTKKQKLGLPSASTILRFAHLLKCAVKNAVLAGLAKKYISSLLKRLDNRITTTLQDNHKPRADAPHYKQLSNTLLA